MDKFSKLIDEFKRISNKGYIKGVRQSFGGIGLTFERKLGKSPDSLYFPDYEGIEIKCTSRFSRYPLYLFIVISKEEVERLFDKIYEYNYR